MTECIHCGLHIVERVIDGEAWWLVDLVIHPYQFMSSWGDMEVSIWARKECKVNNEFHYPPEDT